jgi:hypothetical protein
VAHASGGESDVEAIDDVSELLFDAMSVYLTEAVMIPRSYRNLAARVENYTDISAWSG